MELTISAPCAAMDLSKSPLPAQAVIVLALVLGFASCSRSRAPERFKVPESLQPTLRLPANVWPSHYDVLLSVDPNLATFDGEVAIDLDVRASISSFWLNAENLEISAASIVVAGGDSPIELEVRSLEHDFVSFSAPAALPKGKARLSVRYRGSVQDNDTMGVFRQQAGDDWYVFSQFEATAARSAFPCFDEPNNRATWDVTLEVPSNMQALFNTAAQSQEDGSSGTKRITFATTKPLPSYLVAFAVGPFDIVDYGVTPTGNRPFRIAALRGRGSDSAWVGSIAMSILGVMEEYIGGPYPFDKLDFVAVPKTVGFGAMEHPGLITFTEAAILVKEGEITPEERRRFANWIAHELAHQWFGNLVTMAWWDDLWLNESLATWWAAKVMTQWKPEWNADLEFVHERSIGLATDALDSARRIHEPVVDSAGIDAAFDGITYQKGAAILRMFEHYPEPDTMRTVLRNYLSAHRWGNATTTDFLHQLEAVAGRDARDGFSVFLDENGAPLVKAHIQCLDGKATLKLRQQAFESKGKGAPAHKDWTFPLCYRYAKGKDTAEACLLMSAKQASVALETPCPVAWLVPNREGRGYYRTLSHVLLNRLIKQPAVMSEAEQAAVVDDLGALAGYGWIAESVVGRAAEALIDTDSHHVMDLIAQVLREQYRTLPEDLVADYEAWLRATFASRARTLGWVADGKDDERTGLLRRSLLVLAGELGGDPQLVAGARRHAMSWLARPDGQPELVEVALQTAARHGDQALFDAMLSAVSTAESPVVRLRLVEGFGAFSERSLLEKALALTLGEALDIRDSRRIIRIAASTRWGRAATYDFVVKNFAALSERLPVYARASLIRVAGGQCTEDTRQHASEFFGPRVDSLVGGQSAYRQSLEELSRCVERRAKAAAGLEELLEE